jgi:hypothetical protein
MTAAGTKSGLLAAFQAQLNTDRAPTSGAWSISLSTGASGDGRVTIDCTSGGKLTKTGGVNGTNDAGANITAALTGNGFVEMTAASGTNSTRVVMGLAPSNTSAGRDSGYYLELVEAGDLWVRELGVDISSIGTWAAGDVLRVRRTGTTITYEKNGTVLYTSLASVSGSVFGDFSLRNSSSFAPGIRLYDGTASAYATVAWSNVTNVTTAATTFSLTWTSTNLRDLLGFTADISSANTPQTGTKQAKGVWRPNCPLFLAEATTKMAPRVTDLRSTVGPTRVTYSLKGTGGYEHANLSWKYVPKAQVQESAATYANASWEQFLKDTQWAEGHSWFSTGSLVQIYDENGYILGQDLNSGAGSDGWTMFGVDRFNAKRTDARGYDGLWTIEIPRLASSG